MARKKLPDRTCRKCGGTYPRSAGCCPACKAGKKTGKKRPRGGQRPQATGGGDLRKLLEAMIDARVDARFAAAPGLSEEAVTAIVDRRFAEILGE